MTTPAVKKPVVPWTGIRFPHRRYSVGRRRPMPSEYHSDALILLRLILHHWLPSDDYVGYRMVILNDPARPGHNMMPYLFVAVGAGCTDPYYGDKRYQFRLWDEHALPDVVIDFSTKTFRPKNEAMKRERYATMGVREYILFDPKGSWLSPQLQVYLLQESGQPMVPARRDGSVESTVLGPPISWVIRDHDLRLRDDRSGALLLTPEEQANQARRLADQGRWWALQGRQREARARRVAEAQAQQEAEARRVAEEEVARLRAELDRLKNS